MRLQNENNFIFSFMKLSAVSIQFLLSFLLGRAIPPRSRTRHL